MPLDHVALGQLTLADLEDLVENGVPEGMTLDYKQELPTSQDEAKREFLRDVTSFANTRGGHIVYGITEDAGVPNAVSGIELGDVEAEKLRLENVLRDGVAPRLPHVEFGPVPIDSDRHVLVLRVGQSPARPHMVTFRGLSQFWARNSAGKYQLDVGQIRAAMLSGPHAAERVRTFREERLAQILSPHRLSSDSFEPLLILHLVPLEAFDESRPPLDLSQVRDDVRLRPLYGDQPEPIRWNLDGLHAAPRVGRTSVQLFRNGVIEAVEGWMFELARDFAGAGDDVIQGYPFERTVIDGVARYLSVLDSIGAGLPVAVLLTLVRVERYRILGLDQLDDYRARQNPDYGRLDRDRIRLPEAVFESWDADVASDMRHVFDVFWQAAGFEGSPNYDEDGVWQRRG